MQGVRIAGTGRFLPEAVVANGDFIKIVDTSDEWIHTRTGMSSRHIAGPEPTWYMGAKAAEQAILSAGISPDDIDMLIMTSVNGDYVIPSSACLVQNYLGIGSAIALDVNVACTGLAFAVDMARRYLYTGDVERVLIVCAENLSQITNYSDRSTCILFGDGAGACIVEKGDGVYGSYQNCDASGVKHIHAKKPRKIPPFIESADTSGNDQFPDMSVNGTMYMNGREVYKFATQAMPLAIEKACEKAGIGVDALDIIIPHQANARIIETAIKNLGIPPERFHMNIAAYGNMSSATIAVGLDECVRDGKLRRGDKVCLVGFGAGLTYGATVFEY